MSTTVVNTHEAKSRLSELIRMVEQGEEVIVARNGTAVAKLIAWPPSRVPRRSGAWAGQVTYADADADADADAVGPDPDVTALFEQSAASE